MNNLARHVYPERDRLVCVKEKGGCGDWWPIDKLHHVRLDLVGHVCGEEEWLVPDPPEVRSDRVRSRGAAAAVSADPLPG